MEAALEHVSGGKLLDEEPDECVDMTKVGRLVVDGEGDCVESVEIIIVVKLM